MKDRKLYYYKSESEHNRGSYTGFVDLNSNSSVKQSATVQNGFVILTPNRDWQFKAQTHQEQIDWISAIFLHCQATNDNTVSLKIS